MIALVSPIAGRNGEPSFEADAAALRSATYRFYTKHDRLCGSYSSPCALASSGKGEFVKFPSCRGI